jgi:hypothetical protein
MPKTIIVIAVAAGVLAQLAAKRQADRAIDLMIKTAANTPRTK